MAAPHELRNIGIVAHINAGKTTLTERILFDSGCQAWMGEVDQGTAAMDYMVEEQRRGISITAAATRLTWGPCAINLVDTPGHVDFTGEVGRCLRVLDGVVVVVDGVRGVEPQTEVVWRQAAAWGLPRVVFVNKLDRGTANFEEAVASVAERLECQPVPVAVPSGSDGLAGVLDILGERVLTADQPPRPARPEELEEARAALVEAVAEWDEGVLASFVEGEDVATSTLVRALREGCLRGRCVPVLAGSALQNLGVDALLDAVVAYLPAPKDVVGIRASAHEIAPEYVAEPHPDRTAPACGLVFKVQRHGDERLLSCRMFAGTVRLGDRLACSARGLDWIVEGLWVLHAQDRTPVKVAEAGDIVAMTCTAPLRTGDTFHDVGAPANLERVVFPRPVLRARLEPPSAEHGTALFEAAQAMAEEDPTLEVRPEDSGALVLAGMGELHLEVVREKLEAELGVPVRLGRPTVARFETVLEAGRASIEVHGMVGGVDCFATAEVEVRPLPERGPARLVPTTPDGREDLAWEGIAGEVRGALRTGVRAPHPALGMDVRILSVDGDAPVPDGEGLYLQAVSLALRKAVLAAQPRLLEPEVAIEVACPADVLAGVLRDLKSQGVDLDGVASGMLGGRATGRARLSSLLGYATQLRSMSRGQGVLHLTPVGFVEQSTD